MKPIRIVNRITNKENDSFKKYLNDIAAIPMFTPAEKAECYEKLLSGDPKAKEELIRRNLRFVISIAKQFETADISLADLVNEGNIGLVLAADRYIPSEANSFLTYAVFWIRKLIYEYISNTANLIRLPCNKISSLSKFNSKISELEQRYGRTVDASEALDELRDVLPPKEIEIFERFLTLNVESLDKTFVSGNGENEISLAEILVDESLRSPDYGLEQSDLNRDLNRHLNALKARDKQIMIDLFGLNGTIPKTLEQISEEVGLTREMVRQIKQSSLEKLKKELLKQPNF